MTSKLRCPFCGEELFVGDAFIDIQYANCRNPGCKQCGVVMPVEIWQALIQSLKDRKELAIKLAQTNQALEQSEKCCSAWETQALDYKAETIALSGKLEIATKVLKNMSLGNVPSLPDDETLANAMCNYARDTLKQIEHKE